MTLDRMPRRGPLVLALVSTALGVLPSWLGLGVNVSASAPRGLYRAVSDTPGRASLVVACLPAAVAAFGRARGYLGAGPCAGGAQPVLKQVGGVAGDVIDVAADGLAINGVVILARPLVRHDSAARPLPPLPSGSYRVADGEVWLFGLSHGRSWDSRYFGPVSEVAIRTVRPLLTLSETPR